MNAAPMLNPTEPCLQHLMHDAETMVRKEPAKAMAAAMALGFALHVLPTRFRVAGVAAVTLPCFVPRC